MRRGSTVALGGDGQVTLGNVVVKGGAKKVRRLYHDKILAGFAGGIGERLKQSRRIAKGFAIASASLFLMLAARMAFEKR